MEDDDDYNNNDDIMFSLIRKNKSSNQLEIDDGRQLFGQYDLFNDFLKLVLKLSCKFFCVAETNLIFFICVDF